ncbi:CaiB/BaiF CoA transferase family protein [Phenylobacterium sp.]|uniref:CaiB/BaiF CoA transferase family protein n=1 Tax=Phenylobacterium sp. TaxID=1871053 RepID=UPI0035B04ED7
MNRPPPPQAAGPLCGLRILEFAAIGPGPFCGMMLSDLGADVIRIDRPGAGLSAPTDVTSRGRRSIAVDLKAPGAVELCLRLAVQADGLFEGFRPGVMERLGLGPQTVMARNPGLVYGRMTGWGQDGPLAQAAGHDINYIALSGALHAIGTDEKPTPPLNLVGDFGGGALFLAAGMLAAMLHVARGGAGQVIDAAMCDGAASLMATFYGRRAAGSWEDGRRRNLLDGGAHFYDTYRCADGEWVAIGPLEPQFYGELLRRLGVDDPQGLPQGERTRWPALRERLAAVFATRSRAEWRAVLEGSDACFAPVLSMADAPAHPHNKARGVFQDVAGVIQPAPAPRFSGTPGAIQGPPPSVGAHAQQVLSEFGVSPDEVEALTEAGVIWRPSGR